MDYVNEGDTVAVRLDPGKRALDSPAAVRDEFNVEHGLLTSTDTVDAVTLGHYGIDDQECLEEEFTGQFEVTSFLDNTGSDKIHTHIQVGTRDPKTLGGYCSGARISGTFEVVTHLGETPPTHHLDERTGFDVLDIQTDPDRAKSS